MLDASFVAQRRPLMCRSVEAAAAFSAANNEQLKQLQLAAVRMH